MTYSDVKKIVSQAAFADPKILAKNGLQKLAEHYVAYPIVQGKTVTCLLIRKGLTAKAAAALGEAEAADGQVLVLEKIGSNWTKIWPSTIAG